MRRRFIIGLIIAALLFLSKTLTWAGPKVVDDPSIYTLKLADDSYLTFNAPKRYFQLGKNETDGHPAVRQGWGLGFNVVSAPNARGTDSALYIEVLGQASALEKPKLKDFAAAYKDGLELTIGIRAMALDGADAPDRVKFLMREAYQINYLVHPANTLNRKVAPCIARAFIFDIEGVRVVVSAEGYKERIDPAVGLEKMLLWSKKSSPPGKRPFKMLDTIYGTYRYMLWSVPGTMIPIYDDEVMNCVAAYRVMEGSVQVGTLSIKTEHIGTDIDPKDLQKTWLANGWSKYMEQPDGRAVFYDQVDHKELTYTVRHRDGSGMLWTFTITTLPTKEQAELRRADVDSFAKLLSPVEEKNRQALRDVLETLNTWAVR